MRAEWIGITWRIKFKETARLSRWEEDIVDSMTNQLIRSSYGRELCYWPEGARSQEGRDGGGALVRRSEISGRWGQSIATVQSRCGVFFHISCYEVWDTHTFMNDGFYCIFRVHCDSENTLMSIFKGRWWQFDINRRLEGHFYIVSYVYVCFVFWSLVLFSEEAGLFRSLFHVSHFVFFSKPNNIDMEFKNK